METQLGRFNSLHESPEPLKFAFPIILLPDLFCGSSHMAAMLGYLASIGWEDYAPELSSRKDASVQRITSCADYLARVSEVLQAVGKDTILIGHGLGGTIALMMTELATVKAAAAIAPAIPGFRSPAVGRTAWAIARWTGANLKPPRGRPLFEMIADVEPFQRGRIIKSLRSERPSLALQVMEGTIAFPPAKQSAPRLIVCGDSDRFAPIQRVGKFATSLGAELRTIAGRGHWLIGGRALERTVNQTHRFLVRSLGEELLLLLPPEVHDQT
jgi:pimeloyl-ACP methyl ester carboxylesterase